MAFCSPQSEVMGVDALYINVSVSGGNLKKKDLINCGSQFNCSFSLCFVVSHFAAGINLRITHLHYLTAPCVLTGAQRENIKHMTIQ